MTGTTEGSRVPKGVWLLSACSAVLSSGLGMIVPLIPIYGNDLGASHLELGLLVAGFFAGRLAAQIPAGIIADKLGRRPVLLTALALYAGTCAGFAMSTSPVWLIVFRVLQGIASGLFSISARAAVTDMCGPSIGGRAQGIFSASSNLGFVLGPAVGAFAADHLNYTAPFWAASAASVIAALLLLFSSAGKKTATQEPRGTVRQVKMLLNSHVIRLSAANLFFWAGLSVVMTLFPIVGEKTIQGDVTFVGIAFTSAGFFGLVLGPLTGTLSDLAGRAPVMALGAILSAAEGAALLTTTNPGIIIACFGLGGIGAAAFSNGLYSAVGDITDYSDRGTVNGVVGAAGVIGGIAGALIAPELWRATDLTTPFTAQPAFSIISAVFCVWIWKRRPPKVGKKVSVSETIITG